MSTTTEIDTDITDTDIVDDATQDEATQDEAICDDATEEGASSTVVAERRSATRIRPEKQRDAQPRQLSISLRGAVIGALLVVLLAATCAFAGLWLSARHTNSANETRTANNQHAQQVASDYAVNAATTDYQNLDAWFTKLKDNTTPQLAAKFDASAPQLKEILVPLAWKSTAAPIASVVASETDGLYKVNTFVDVSSTSQQAPNGSKTTVTYTVTVDRNQGWKIVDVGGLGGVLPN